MNARTEWLGGNGTGDREAFQRSLDVSGAGPVLLQTVISKIVQLATNREFGAVTTLPRKPGSGDKFYSNRRAAATTGAAWVADTTEPTESEGAYTQVGFTYQTLLGRVKVTRKLIARGRTYGDVLATELTGKAEDWTNELESASFIGDSASSTYQIDGLLTLISGVSGQTVANTNASGGTALDLDALDNAIQTVKGSTNQAAMRIYVSRKGKRLLNAALQSQQRFNDSIVIDAGFSVTSYNGIPVIETTGIPDVLTWNPATPKVLAYSGGATTAAVIVNTNYVFYSELTPMTVMPLAKKSSQYDEYDMFADLALVLDNPKGAAILAGLS